MAKMSKHLKVTYKHEGEAYPLTLALAMGRVARKGNGRYWSELVARYLDFAGIRKHYGVDNKVSALPRVCEN